MANKNDKHDGNIEGVFYVDKTCIDCLLCQSLAPDNFKRNDEGEYSYVFKQPENDEEYQLCLDALGSCPVDSIGEDGDE